MKRATSAAASLLVLAFTSPLVASERFVQAIGVEAARDRLDAACAAAGSSACSEELENAAREAGKRLVELARSRPELAAPLAARAADSGLPELRAAAAEALAQPMADAAATPLLLELLDDPVPAVRNAAFKALRSSNDEAARPYVARAEAFDRGDEEGLEPDAAPPAAKAGVSLPADAAFLRFASDPASGRLSYVTAESPAKLLAALAKKGKGPYTPEQFRAELERQEESVETKMKKLDPGDGMPDADQMAQMMAMAQKMMEAMEKSQGASPQQQAQALAQAAGQSLLQPGLADAYADSELFGDPKLVIVSGADGSEVAVAIYRDLALGKTGITVHRPGGFEE